jgi:DNA polymerase-4/DNA polymerase V
MQWIYGLADMQSFYASCEVASRSEFAAQRQEDNDDSDPALVVAGDPQRRTGIILAATPPAKRLGVNTAMTLGDALRLAPDLIVVRPRMEFYLQVSVRIQLLMKQFFPLQEQFSIDEGFFAFPWPSDLFPDPLQVAQELRQAIWDQFHIRCRIGLSYNKWMAKMANNAAKKSPYRVTWWQEDDVLDKLQTLSVFDMWGLKKRAQVLHDEFQVETIGDVANLSIPLLRHRFGVWGEIIHRWSTGHDFSPINPNAYHQPHKGLSHRITLPRDYEERDDIKVVILELLDEVTWRVRVAGQRGRRVGLGVTYAGFSGGFYRTKSLSDYTQDTSVLYPEVLSILDQYWNGSRVRAIAIALDMLQSATSIQLSFFGHVQKREQLIQTVDELRLRFGEASVMRAVSLTRAGQLRDRSKKIGGHYRE